MEVLEERNDTIIKITVDTFVGVQRAMLKAKKENDPYKECKAYSVIKGFALFCIEAIWNDAKSFLELFLICLWKSTCKKSACQRRHFKRMPKAFFVDAHYGYSNFL